MGVISLTMYRSPIVGLMTPLLTLTTKVPRVAKVVTMVATTMVATRVAAMVAT